MWSGYNQSVETDVVREGHGSIDANQCKLEKNSAFIIKVSLILQSYCHNRNYTIFPSV